MRVMPLITAAIVIAALYGLVFERERVMSYVLGESAPEAEETAATEAAPVETAAAEPDVRRVSVVTIASTAQVIDRGVVVRGRTEALRSVDVMSETAGRVISDPLRRGRVVEAGEVMCQIDPGTRQQTLLEAEARLAEAEVNAVAADRLAEGGFASETRLVGAQASLQAAQAAVERAQEDIKNLTISAPFTGVLEDDTAELGALLSAGGGLCGTILQLDPIKVVGFVPETLVRSVRVGAPAGARLTNGQELTGTVTFVSRLADENTRTFRVEVEVANPEMTIRGGETAEILIMSDGVPAHLLPASALTLNDGGILGVRHAIDAPDGTGKVTAFAPLRIVRDTIEGIWAAGLPDELEVIVVGQDFVTAGTPVSVTRQDDAS